MDPHVLIATFEIEVTLSSGDTMWMPGGGTMHCPECDCQHFWDVSTKAERMRPIQEGDESD
jgi:hypothetical protein